MAESVSKLHEQQKESKQSQARPCPKDCRKCTMSQQICCSSILSFQMFDVMNTIIQRLDIQSHHLSALEDRISSIQSSESELASPVFGTGGFSEQNDTDNSE